MFIPASTGRVASLGEALLQEPTFRIRLLDDTRAAPVGIHVSDAITATVHDENRNDVLVTPATPSHRIELVTGGVCWADYCLAR